MYHVTDERRRRLGHRAGISAGRQREGRRPDPLRLALCRSISRRSTPATGKTLDATKPVGEWNHVRLLITPEKCEHEINGVKYFEYVLHSDDFNARVAKSKFANMPDFAKSDIGYIALQGDHGTRRVPQHQDSADRGEVNGKGLGTRG